MIVQCPYCILQGEKRNLAEILPDGSIKILRLIKENVETLERTIDFTIIQTPEFNLICGNCGNTVIYKRPIISQPQVNIMTTWGTMLQFYEKSSFIR